MASIFVVTRDKVLLRVDRVLAGQGAVRDG